MKCCSLYYYSICVYLMFGIYYTPI